MRVYLHLEFNPEWQPRHWDLLHWSPAKHQACCEEQFRECKTRWPGCNGGDAGYLPQQLNSCLHAVHPASQHTQPKLHYFRKLKTKSLLSTLIFLYLFLACKGAYRCLPSPPRTPLFITCRLPPPFSSSDVHREICRIYSLKLNFFFFEMPPRRQKREGPESELSVITWLSSWRWALCIVV